MSRAWPSRRLHARAPVALGGVACVVRALPPRLHLFALFEHGHTGAERDVEALRAARGVRDARKAIEQSLDEAPRVVRSRSGKQDAELLAAAAADHVLHTHVRAEEA